MEYVHKLGLDTFIRRWEDTQTFIHDRFTHKEPHQISTAAVILEDTEDYIKAMLIGAHCKECGCELVFDVCDHCGNQVIGCMHCHLDAHAILEEIQPTCLHPQPVVYMSDLQYHGENEDAIEYLNKGH